MEPFDLLDYALGWLDGPRREQIEQQLASDPELAGRVDRLICNLARLLDDGRWLPPTRRTFAPRWPADSIEHQVSSSFSLLCPDGRDERPRPDPG